MSDNLTMSESDRQFQEMYKLCGTTQQADANRAAELHAIHERARFEADTKRLLAEVCFNKNGNGIPTRSLGEHPCKVKMPGGNIELFSYDVAITAILVGKGVLLTDACIAAMNRDTSADPPRARKKV
jgi:hypothetical protein